jgi:uncharacterized protein (TIGR03083 family)
MDRATTLDALDLESSRFLVAVSSGTASLKTPVPTCPDWDMSQLVNHLGYIYSRTALIVSDRRAAAPDRSELPVPPEDDARIGWFAEQRTAMLTALEATPDDALVWNFAAGGPAPASFWPRRMAQETLIHRVDAELAQSLTPALGDPELAADNIAEFFEIFFPRFEARLLESGPAGSLHLHATDVPEAEWTLDLRPGGSVLTREHTRGDASVRGSAFDLACWAWRRLPAARLETFGDPQIASRFQEAARI